MENFILSDHLQDTLQAARWLLGKVLWHQSPEGITAGRIVETEAYLSDDPASHSFKGRSQRNQAMFDAPGRAYIYTIYGIHLCFNVVTAAAGQGEAVLIRALEPLEGLDLMRKRRSGRPNLCQGPACLVQALGITLDYNHWDLSQGKLQIKNGLDLPAKEIACSRRIGLSKAQDRLWRFFWLNSVWVSRR